MGRPLNKKYFGNRNIGTTGTADDKIGGEGVASITVGTAGTYTTGTTITFANTPKLPGGVRATGTLTYRVVSATVGNAGTGYGNAQTFDLTVLTAGGTAVLNVTSNAGGGIATINSVVTAGVFTGISNVSSVSGGSGTGGIPTLTYGILGVTMTEQGSGYTSAPVVTIGAGAGAATAVLTVDTGAVGSATNEENAIIAYGYVTGNSLIADIIKQVNTRSYKIITSEGTLVCKLVTDGAANAVGEMTITATDTAGKTYYVSKLTSRKAVVVPYGSAGHLFESGACVKWGYTADTGVVSLANA